MDIAALLYTASTWVVPVLLAITLHEAAHAYSAWRLGDDTAYRLGRVTFNPIKHVDPFGTVILPALLLILKSPFLFGWAKPVPVVFANLRNPRGHMVLVAAAGPAMNILLATISAILLRFIDLVPDAAHNWTEIMLANSIMLNLILAVFNMIPLPPLDGGHIAIGLLPDSLAYPFAKLAPYGMFILIGFIVILPMIGGQLGINLNVFHWIVLEPVRRMLPFFTTLAGVG